VTCASSTALLMESLQNGLVSINCQLCSNNGVEGTARAYFEAPPPSVVLCANRLKT
jgi:hypothetical protein